MSSPMMATRWRMPSAACCRPPTRSSAEIGALTEQRDELDAILRSMTEAVVVTGARGEVILLNGQARKTFALERRG